MSQQPIVSPVSAACSQRVSTKAADEILHRYFPVLDHGFVSLVDYMGNDESIERAARVSYGAGTRATSDTRTLLRYLRRHAHTTPFEMVELVFHCAMPIFIARQWIRHRTACLSGDAVLSFDLPGAKRRGTKRQHRGVAIKDFHDRWHNGTEHPIEKHKPTFVERVNPSADYTIPELSRLVERREESLRNMVREGRLDARRNPSANLRDPSIFVSGSAWHRWAETFCTAMVDMKPALRQMQLRCCNESTKEITHTTVTNVWESGEKTVYEVVVGEMTLKMSKDHRCFTSMGWLTLEEILRMCGRELPTNGCAADGVGIPIKMCVIGSRELAPYAAPLVDNTPEEWLPVKGWEDRYSVSSHGRVARITEDGIAGKIKKLTNSRGYAVVSLNRPGEQVVALVHHLVLRAFAGSCPDGMECRHLDGNRENNRVSNLAWGTVQENANDRVRHGMTTKSEGVFRSIDSVRYAGEEMTYDLEVEGPWHNFVAGGMVVHNSTNEASGRYSLIPELFYTPASEQMGKQSQSNRQGRSEGTVDSVQHQVHTSRWEANRVAVTDHYRALVREDVARELARIDLPLSTYTQWYWKMDLHNLFHFLKLRVDSHAQWEIQQYARVMAGMVQRVAPLAFEAWVDYEFCATKFSRVEMEAILLMIGPDRNLGDVYANSALTKRELLEFREKISAKPDLPNFSLDPFKSFSADYFENIYKSAAQTSGEAKP